MGSLGGPLGVLGWFPKGPWMVPEGSLGLSVCLCSKIKSCLQAQKQLQEVKQQLSQGLIQSPRASRRQGTPQQANAPARAASDSPRAATDSPRAEGLTTPSPFSSSRDVEGSQAVPDDTAGAEGSPEKKPFLRRRSRNVPVSQRQARNQAMYHSV